ncbi:hypothetical protein BGZ81_009530 [Podila clonocystis]|nr:hypothetical protein BGZ81_009530 [Podila clonocystis]
MVHIQNTDSSKRYDSFRNSEWGPEVAEALARDVRDIKGPGDKDGKVRTLGEYVDRDLMSKMVLEEIVFDTWYGGRTALLGDGAIIAIQDAVTLANWLSTLQLPGERMIEDVFWEYRAERYPVAEAFESSQMFTRNLEKNLISVLVRGMLKRIPRWLWKRISIKTVGARHQPSFLHMV